jgi:hypothetical protein
MQYTMYNMYNERVSFEKSSQEGREGEREGWGREGKGRGRENDYLRIC